MVGGIDNWASCGVANRKPRVKRGMPLFERIYLGIDVRGEDECWPWIGNRNYEGYGVVYMGRGQLKRPHRLLYELLHGKLDSKTCVCHTCDNPPCCNPRHLFAGTIADNNRDRKNKGRYPWSAEAKGRRKKYNQKLTDADVSAIRAARLGGERLESIAARFGVSRGYVGHIVNGRSR